MNIISKKGYALSIAIIFTVVSITASIGLYASIRYFVVETRIKEVEYIRGYYAALAGLRYAAILLRDPASLGLVNPGDQYQLPQDNPVDLFIQQAAFDNLIITITQRSDGDFDISATYPY